MKDIRFFITITKRDDSEEYIEFYKKNGVPIIYSAKCNGTAKKKTLDLLGLEKTDKDIHFAVLPEPKVKQLKKKLVSEMLIDLPDQGIAMAIPMESMGLKTLEYLLHGQEICEKENREMLPMTETELIVAITNTGYIDNVMDAALSAGATGGTVIHAKGTLSNNAEKFFGVSIAEEREIIFIVTKVDIKKDIMKAIMKDAGIHTEARTVLFSLPVTESAGFIFRKDDDSDTEEQIDKK